MTDERRESDSLSMERQPKGHSWGSRLAHLEAVEALARQEGWFEQENADGQIVLLPYDDVAKEGFAIAREIYREGIRREWESRSVFVP